MKIDIEGLEGTENEGSVQSESDVKVAYVPFKEHGEVMLSRENIDKSVKFSLVRLLRCTRQTDDEPFRAVVISHPDIDDDWAKTVEGLQHIRYIDDGRKTVRAEFSTGKIAEYEEAYIVATATGAYQIPSKDILL